MKKALIVKLGYSETLAGFLNLGVSLGDVLRTTFILHYFKDYSVSWLVDYKAAPLLEDNEHIDRILIYKPSIVDMLKEESFDVVINFEKSLNFIQLTDSINSQYYFGFTSNCNSVFKSGDVMGDKKLVEISKDLDKKRENKNCWQDILAQSTGNRFKGESYILGYKPKSKIVYDVGFNWTTSSNWRNKFWPYNYWKKLGILLENKYVISWQQGMDNLYDYMEWINSCRLIVTADTLGLHLALALQKRVVALFGPTPPEEVYLYNLGSYLTPDSPYDCIPCVNLSCNKEMLCMEYIYPEKVKKAIDYEFGKIKSSSRK